MNILKLCRKIVKENKNIMFVEIYQNNNLIRTAHILYLLEKERKQDTRYKDIITSAFIDYKIDNERHTIIICT